MERVVITGLGPVSSIGIGVDAFRTALFKGTSGIREITGFDVAGFPFIRGGEVAGFRPESLLRRLAPQDWGRASLFAAAAARLAFEDAGLDADRLAPERAGVVMGTTSGESKVAEAIADALVAGGVPAVTGELFARLPAGRLAQAASEELCFCSESVTLTTACSASNYALGYAYDGLAHNDADVMVAGGADAMCRWAHAGFHRLGALAETHCAPFDRDRSGILTAEGGAALVLETRDHALARGARIYAEVLGYAMNCDAAHVVAPDAGSIARCMRLAHQNASIAPEDVDYVCAHGTGTTTNDAAEARALREVFGEAVPPTSSIKSMLGHTMGAASGFGAIASTLAITHGLLPPTVNQTVADPELPWLDTVPNQARRARVRVAQNNGFAFGGNNAIVLLAAP